MRQPKPSTTKPERQRGVVLIVALIMLLLITIVSLTSLRTITLQERMASNSYDRNLAFQAAEAALREGEAVAEAQSLNVNGPNGAFPGVTQQHPACGANHCGANGLCNQPHPECAEAWTLPDGAVAWANAVTPLLALAGQQPQYIVEYLGNTFACQPGQPATAMNCKRYRITARAQPGEGRAMVMLQSLYATE